MPAAVARLDPGRIPFLAFVLPALGATLPPRRLRAGSRGARTPRAVAVAALA